MNMVRTRLRSVSIGVTVVALAAAGLPAQAQESGTAPRPAASAQQNIGLLSGLAVGAAAGGPIGAIVGGAAGAWFGERYHRQSIARHEAAASLQQSEAERTRLTQDVSELHVSLTRQQERDEKLDTALNATNEVATEVSFRTDADTIQADAVTPLLKLGALAAALRDASVRVVGYADPRGSESYNMELSRRRAEAVADVLAMSGVDRQRLVIEARGKGDSVSADGDSDGYALERHVTVRIERGQAVARNE